MNFLGKIKVKPTGNINIGNDIAYADVDSFEKIGLVTEGLSRQYADCLYKIPKECHGLKYSRFSISHENKNWFNLSSHHAKYIVALILLSQFRKNEKS